MRRESGTALFIILIAVALFAALSYAVTQSGRGGGGSISKENAVLLAAQITQNLNAIQQAALRMNLTGTPYNSMKFYTVSACGPAFTLCNSGTTCLFAPEGGGAIVPKIPASAFKTVGGGAAYPGQPSTLGLTNIWVDCDADVGDWGLGTSAVERGFYLLNVNKDVCLAFNKGLGLNGIPGDDLPIVGDLPISASANVGTWCRYKDKGAPWGWEYEVWQAIYIQ